MSETQSRQTQSSRGRSSARGGRGGYGGAPRGGSRTSNKPRNADNKTIDDNDMLADQGELGEMKKRYSSQLNTLKELFPDWTEVDLVLALEETDGDLQSTIERISEGKTKYNAIVQYSLSTIFCFRKCIAIFRDKEKAQRQS